MKYSKHLILVFIILAMQGCISTATKSAYIEYPQKIKSRLFPDFTDLKSYILVPNEIDGKKNSSLYKAFSKHVEAALKKQGYIKAINSMPDQLIYLYFTLEKNKLDTHTPIDTTCHKGFGDTLNCSSTGGNQNNLYSMYINLLAFDTRETTNKNKSKVMWELKSILRQVNPYFGPDVIFKNMANNISPYIGRDTKGEIEVSYP